jgi:hypothetical protein
MSPVPTMAELMFSLHQQCCQLAKTFRPHKYQRQGVFFNVSKRTPPKKNFFLCEPVLFQINSKLRSDKLFAQLCTFLWTNVALSLATWLSLQLGKSWSSQHWQRLSRGNIAGRN